MTLTTDSASPLPDGGHCPACGSTLERVHRHALDRWVSVFRAVHRYRCTAAACGWEGVLGRDHAPVAAPARLTWSARLIWFVVGAGVALAAVQGLRVMRAKTAGPSPAQVAQAGVEAQSRATDPGDDFAGATLPDGDRRVKANPSPLTLRHSCAWGVPGGNPYRGTVQQALAAAGLPAEVVRTISDMAERGWVHDQVEISRTGIRSVDGRREFGNHIRAMAFGNTLCFNTRVNFKPGHVEHAAYYEVTDSQQRTYRVLVPYVCQNVAVLGQRGEIDDDQDVPEPATLALALLALGLALGLTGRARQGRRP